MANGASQPLFALVFANVLTALGTPRANDYALLFVALAFGAFLSNFLQIGLFGYAAQKMTRRVREACFRSILRQEMAFFDREENATGSLTQKLSSEASSIAGLTGQSVGALLQGIAGIATGLTLAFIASWRLSLLILGMVPLIGFAGYLQLRALVGFGEKTRIAYEDSNKRANETILNIRTVATLTQERSFYGQYAQSMFAPHRIAVKGAVVSSVGFAVSQAVLHFAWAASLFYGSYLLKIEIHQPTDILNSMCNISF